jgi:hypothetical protein
MTDKTSLEIKLRTCTTTHWIHFPTSSSNIGTSPLSPKQLMHFARMPRAPISPHTALPLCRAKCSDHPSGTRMHSIVRTRVPHPLDILALTYSAENCPSANTVSSLHSKASTIRASAMPTSYSSLVHHHQVQGN